MKSTLSLFQDTAEFAEEMFWIFTGAELSLLTLSLAACGDGGGSNAGVSAGTGGAEADGTTGPDSAGLTAGTSDGGSADGTS